MSVLDVRDVSVSYGSLSIIESISFSVEEYEWVMIVGPNGSGKSTTIHAITRGAPYTGTVCFEGRDISTYTSTDLAKQIGVLMQDHMVGYSFTVEEVVRLGRYAYSKGLFSAFSDEDEEKVRYALELTGMYAARDQSVLTLSGGELQRTFLAQLFAQDPKLLVLDEPTNHLDLVYQKQIFELIRDWIMRTGRCVISVVHDLSLAKYYGTRVLLLHKGKVVALGSPHEVLTKEYLNDIYMMDVYGWMNVMLSQWKD
ncbi:MAG: ABC transporter ATP-binding protein [Methanomicrobiales archaeon]|jgi:iron complex transport system ATP-binding protein|nr:ABC transporter ATP-binding protein [Methanomicrobiales archaeon]